jgi:multiple antibiotic resistance protein
MDWGELVRFFAALFAIMNPIGNMPIFLSVTEGRTDAERSRTAFVAATAVAAILSVCVLIGAQLLHVFGISVDALRTAGGLIILSIAYSLLHAEPSGMHHDPAEMVAQENPGVYPLAMPLLAGPGAIATVIVFAYGARGAPPYAGLIGVVLVMAVLLLLGMRLAVPASRLFGPAGMNIITRVMGIILAAIAVEMVFAGARGLLKS